MSFMNTVQTIFAPLSKADCCICMPVPDASKKFSHL